MGSVRETFVHTVAAILSRYSRQNNVTPPAETDATHIGERLWTLIESRGLPRPLRTDEMGSPGEMSAAEVEPLVAAILEGIHEASILTVPVRQLVKTCFHPEFKKCRDSYREAEADGTCRRQQLERALVRVSGSHCVDCPYWTALTPDQHRECLRDGWRGDAGLFEQHENVFLPEDFRVLRKLVREHARQ